MKWIFLLTGLSTLMATVAAVAGILGSPGDVTVFQELSVIGLWIAVVMQLGLFSVIGAIERAK